MWNNVGDVSMLLTTIERLRELWPEASFEVITAQPDQLAAYVPDAQGLVSGCVAASIAPKQRNSLKKLLRDWLPSETRKYFTVFQKSFKKRVPIQTQENKKLLTAISQADAVVMSGVGVITDTFLEDAWERLELLEEAANRGKPTAIFGQGIGPVEAPYLIKQIKTVLPKIDLICLREQYNSLSLLAQCRVDPSKIIVTGDDAIEMAYLERSDTLGNHIGINIRVSPYSELSSSYSVHSLRSESSLKRELHTALFTVATQHNISLIPVPIALPDRVSIRELLQIPNIEYPAHTPWKIIEEIKHCRVVVTGSYHAAVFALSQGVSAICLAKSSYYVHKFSGLADQFSGGCEILSLDDTQLKEKLQTALENSLQNAQENRPKLLQKAQLQIQASRDAYRKFYDLAEGKRCA